MLDSCLQAIYNAAKATPDKSCVIDQSGVTTYGAYWNRILSVATDLCDRGVKAGDKIVLIAQQSAEYLTCFHAAQLMGAIPVPLERTTKADYVREIVSQTEATLVITKKAFDTLECIEYADMAYDKQVDTSAFSMPAPDATSSILFTTGTTGKVKGVVMSFKADVAVAENVLYGVKMKSDNVEIIPMPLNHSFALRRYFANLINGSTVILLDGVIYVKKVFEALDNYGATALAINPSALAILFKLTGDMLGKYKDQIHYIQFGSAHLPDEDKKRLRELLPGTPLYDIYGSTEAGCACILDFGNDEVEKSVGKPAIHADFRVVDMDGNLIESSLENPGRLICSGAMRMDGYYNDPQITAETMIDGYVYSNDLSYIDADGYVYLLGRCDDVIASGGNKISPQDVEDVANQYAGIADCACIGVPDEVLGNVPKLFVVPAKGYNEGELMAFLNQKLEYFMVPKSVEEIDEIPKTFNGKILRRQLRDRAN